MIPAPTDTLEAVILSTCHALGALRTASKHKDRRFNAEHKAYFATKYVALGAILTGLENHESTLRNRARREGKELQMAVEFADDTTDTDFAFVVKTSTLAVEGKGGLPPVEVFGRRIADVIDLPMRVEVRTVREAADRMKGLGEFDKRDEYKTLLLDSAEQEEAALDAREAGDRVTGDLEVAAAVAKLEAVLFLNKFLGELQEKFPRERKLQALFFLKGKKAKAKKKPASPEPKV